MNFQFPNEAVLSGVIISTGILGECHWLRRQSEATELIWVGGSADGLQDGRRRGGQRCPLTFPGGGALRYL